jgi:glycosyltransferase involved in cell wall biosynthesis
MTTISIIVPVHNAEQYLRQCIDSILVQSFKDFELILINDGSTDKSGEICDEFARVDTRIKVIHKEYGGVSSARNIGLSTAVGKYIAFVDSDDYIDKDMYKELYRLCLETNSDIAICKLGREVDGKLINKTNEEFIKEMDNIEAIRELFNGILYRFSLCNKLFKSICFKDIVFPEGRIHEDLSTTYKLFANSKKAIFTNYIGYIYVKRDNSILTSKFNAKRLDAFIAWDEIIIFMKKSYLELSKEVATSFVYGCIDNIFYTLNQVKNTTDKRNLLISIQKCIRKHFKFIIQGNNLSIKYKCLIASISINIYLILLFNKIRSLTRSKGKVVFGKT